MKHTPGPWNFADLGRKGYFIVSEDLRIAKLTNLREYGQRTSTDLDAECANARLIAAAPDLYDAAHNLISVCLTYGVNPDHPSIVHAYNAIQKAEGK